MTPQLRQTNKCGLKAAQPDPLRLISLPRIAASVNQLSWSFQPVREHFLYVLKGGAFGAAAGRTAACGSPGPEG
jgi:hypothetical protein